MRELVKKGENIPVLSTIGQAVTRLPSLYATDAYTTMSLLYITLLQTCDKYLPESEGTICNKIGEKESLAHIAPTAICNKKLLIPIYPPLLQIVEAAICWIFGFPPLFYPFCCTS